MEGLNIDDSVSTEAKKKKKAYWQKFELHNKIRINLPYYKMNVTVWS